jgi:hypothetical protein
MASLGDKVEMARTAKKPVWSQRFLAEQLAGRLARTAESWETRIKDIETRRTPSLLELAEISEVLGTVYEWQCAEDDVPVQWRNAYDLSSRSGGQIVMERRAPYWGHVPSWGWSEPTGSVDTLPTTYDGDDGVIFKVRTEINVPRFQPRIQVVVNPTGEPVQDVYNVLKSPDNELQMGKLRRIEGRWKLEFANTDYSLLDVDDWNFIGHVVHAEESDEGGLR